MRELIDVKGYRVRVATVSGHYAYVGLIEGNPYLARKFRLMSSKKKMECLGTYVFGMPELERETAMLDNTCDEWPAREAWDARLSDGIDFRQGTTRVAHIFWFQEGGDPMRRLQEIVETLDFLAIAVQVKADLSD